jgi:two-component system sensor histidine kinase CiaH
MFERVRIRLVVVNFMVIAGIVLALGIGIVVAMDHFLVDQRAETLRTVAREVVEHLQANPGDPALPTGRENAGIFAAAWSAGGQLVLDPAGIGADALGPAAAEATANGSQAVIDLPTGGEAVVVSFLAQGGPVVQVGQDLAPVRAIEQDLVVLIVVVGSIGLVLALVAGWILADRAVRPIHRAFDRQREFAADASHELRTPLAVVDAGLQLLTRHPTDTVGEHGETVDAMRAETGRMSRLVGGLLTLARADAGAAEIVPVETDLDALVRGAVAGYVALGDARDAAIELGEVSAGTARVDPDRIVELLGILVDNALVHGGPGVHVRVEARRSGGIELVVSDGGPGIPEAQRLRVLERFARGDAGRSGGGAGLGLSIASWIVDAHRGRLALEDNQPGLRVRVTLPG